MPRKKKLLMVLRKERHGMQKNFIAKEFHCKIKLNLKNNKKKCANRDFECVNKNA